MSQKKPEKKSGKEAQSGSEALRSAAKAKVAKGERPGQPRQSGGVRLRPSSDGRVMTLEKVAERDESAVPAVPAIQPPASQSAVPVAPAAQPAAPQVVSARRSRSSITGERGAPMTIGERAEISVISEEGGDASAHKSDLEADAKATVIAARDDVAKMHYVQVKKNAVARVSAGKRALEILDALERKKDLAQLGFLQKDIEDIKKRFDIDGKSEAERNKIRANPALNEYYEMIRSINDQFIVAKQIQTGKLAQADETGETIIKGINEIAKQIPVASLISGILTNGALGINSVKKHRAMRRLSDWVPPDATLTARLAERFAREMTLRKEQEILTPPKPETWSEQFKRADGIIAKAGMVLKGAKRLKDAAGQKAHEVKKGVSYSDQERLALADMTRVLEAIMAEEVVCQKGGSDAQKLDSCLAKMLQVFPQSQSQIQPKPLPQSQASASVAAAPSAVAFSSSSSSSSSSAAAAGSENLLAAASRHFSSSPGERKLNSIRVQLNKAQRQLDNVIDKLNLVYPEEEGEHTVDRAKYLAEIGLYEKRRDALTEADYNKLVILEDDLAQVEQSLTM